MSNASLNDESLTDAYRILREVTGGQEPYASVVPEMARALDRFRDRVLLEAMVPFQNLLSSLTNDARGSNKAKQDAISSFYRRLDAAIRHATLPRDAPELGEQG